MASRTALGIVSSKQALSLALAVLLTATSAASFSANKKDSKVYYRYVNEQGVQVLHHSIPPEYAQKGYEVVSLSGEVIKTVPPAPDAEDLARRQVENKIKADYRRLTRRYSSQKELELAKQRKLDDIDTNIAIVRGNISGLEAQIRNLLGQAAAVERQGRDVPDSLLKKLADVRAELAVAENMLEARVKEQEAAAARFDQDMETYAKGQALANNP